MFVDRENASLMTSDYKKRTDKEQKKIHNNKFMRTADVIVVLAARESLECSLKIHSEDKLHKCKHLYFF